MPAPPPSPPVESAPAEKAARKRKSPAWWVISLVVHGALLGLLLLIFPYREFVKPAAREKQAAPLVNQKTLEQTAKRVEEKQAEEMARKLRELAALRTDIQSVEVKQRTAHAAFATTITEISPALATNLAGTARGQLSEYLALQKGEDEAWAAFQAESAKALPGPEGAPLKPGIEALAQAYEALTSAQNKLNFAQAALLDTQQQMAGRLGFLKSSKPALVEKQATLVSAWSVTMELGAAYTGALSAARELYDSAGKRADEVSRALKSLAERQSQLAEIENAVAKQTSEAAKGREKLASLNSERETLNPPDKKKLKDLDGAINRVTQELRRSEGKLKSDETTNGKREAAAAKASEALEAKREELRKMLESISAARQAFSETRKPYLQRMRAVLDAQKSLDETMTATLAESPQAP